MIKFQLRLMLNKNINRRKNNVWNKEKEKELKLKRFIVMRKYKEVQITFYTERGFADKKFADAVC